MSQPTHKDFSRIRSPFDGAQVRLRAVEEADIQRISEMFNDPDVLRYLDAVTFPQSQAGTSAWWTEGRAKEDAITFAIETLSGELVGACSLEGVNRRNRTAVLGIWIGQAFWERGYGSDAVRVLCRFGFQSMNLQRITLHVLEGNDRGKRAYEKVGFKEEGRLRRSQFVGGGYIDTIVMGLLAEELIEA